MKTRIWFVAAGCNLDIYEDRWGHYTVLQSSIQPLTRIGWTYSNRFYKNKTSTVFLPSVYCSLFKRCIVHWKCIIDFCCSMVKINLLHNHWSTILKRNQQYSEFNTRKMSLWNLLHWRHSVSALACRDLKESNSSLINYIRKRNCQEIPIESLCIRWIIRDVCVIQSLY